MVTNMSAIEVVGHVDRRRCEQVARQLQIMSLPSPKEDVPPMPFSKAEEANFWFLLAAICHQTSPVGLPPLEGIVDGTHRKGWDFLVHAFRVAAVNDRSLLKPSVWRDFTSNQMESIFGEFLSSPHRRAKLVCDLGQRLCDLGWDSILVATDYCDHSIRAHNPNLLEVLSEFDAYSDPVEKKSVFFLALMRNCGLWSYIDEALLPAPVDYHEVRGHLRIGTAKIDDQELLRKICRGTPVGKEDDIALRMVVREAIQLISEYVGNSPNALHYFFWNLFRTYCVRNTPKCDGSNSSRLPLEYLLRIERVNNGSSHCPFRSFCESADHTTAVNEHLVETEFY